MKRVVIAVVMAAVGLIGMGRTASSSEEHMTVAGGKLDGGLVHAKAEDSRKYVK